VSCSRAALADEGGVSFWLPGNFGSFVAAPGDPGWTLPIIYYNTAADAGADKTFPRGGRVTVGVDAGGSSSSSLRLTCLRAGNAGCWRPGVGRRRSLGTNHWAIDGGGGYTYLDPKQGHELSAALGFTYNLENPDTHYRNGLSTHLDCSE
jgi:hypothetical protein